MVRSNLEHAWKQIYEDVNKLYNDHSIPNMNRIKFLKKEMEYISLYVHKVLLSNLDIVRLQDTYEIVYFINPQGIWLENPESCQIVNHINTKFLRVKN